jgi:hypothetical protein
VANASPQPLYPRERDQVPICIEGWVVFHPQDYWYYNYLRG